MSLIDSVSVRLQCLFVPLSFSLTGYLLFSIYLPLSVFVCLSVSLSVFQSVCLSFSVCMPLIFCMSDCHVLSLCLSLSASLYLSASDCPGIFVRLFVSVCFCLSNCLKKVLYIFLSFCPSVFCLSVCLYVCLYVCLFRYQGPVSLSSDRQCQCLLSIETPRMEWRSLLLCPYLRINAIRSLVFSRQVQTTP